MRRPLASLVLFSLPLLALARPASATLCAADVVPAATLLLPYFEVDLNDPAGPTTLFAITNVGSTPVAAQVVLWTDLAVPTFTFPIYLTGYDVQTINLHDVFVDGKLPRTGAGVSPQGPISETPQSDHPGCLQLLPAVAPAPAFLAGLRAAHTGVSSSLFSNQCSGLPYGDGIARGFLTVDAVKDCTTRFPTEPAYWSEVGQFDNVLLGDYFYLSSRDSSAQGEPMVHLEAAPNTFPLFTTFWSGALGGTTFDRREPLGNRMQSRYALGGGFSGGTGLIVWRDPRTPTHPFACGWAPPWFPLPISVPLIAFDEQENAVELGTPCPFECPVPLGSPFPAAAQRVDLGSDEAVPGGQSVAVPFNFGWIGLKLSSLPPFSFPSSPDSQAWVETTMTAAGRFSVGFRAAQTAPGCNLVTQTLAPAHTP